MAKGRATVLGVIDGYLVSGYDDPITLFEIEKLVCWLNEFAKHRYGACGESPVAVAVPSHPKPPGDAGGRPGVY